MNLSQAITWGSQELEASSDTAHLDAEVLLSDLLQVSRAYLIAHAERVLTSDEEDHYHQSIARRKKGEPLAYIVGHKEFWSLDLRVTPATLVPRPETELLVELALVLLPHDKVARRVADLGTGSGAIALALARERPNWEIYATDQSAEALQVAQQNAASLKISSLQFLQGRWCSALPQQGFDAVLSNPPYLTEAEWKLCSSDVHHEPQSALVSGADGLQDLSEIIGGAKEYLNEGGYLLLEHGSTQADKVRSILQKEGYTEINSYRDLAGMERVTGGRWQAKARL